MNSALRCWQVRSAGFNRRDEQHSENLHFWFQCSVSWLLGRIFGVPADRNGGVARPRGVQICADPALRTSVDEDIDTPVARSDSTYTSRNLRKSSCEIARGSLLRPEIDHENVSEDGTDELSKFLVIGMDEVIVAILF